MSQEGPVADATDNRWEAMLADLQGGVDEEGLKGLDRLASLDMVSDFLSSEGYEGYKSPGPGEGKLTRIASLELLTELFEGERGLTDDTLGDSGQVLNPLEEGSGVSNDWMDEHLLTVLGSGREEEGARRSVSATTGTLDSGKVSGKDKEGRGGSAWESEWAAQEGFQGGSRVEPGKRLVNKKKHKPASVHAPLLSPLGAPTHRSPPPREMGRLLLPATPPPLSEKQSENLELLSGPRMRFSPQQQKALNDFGASVNWVAMGLEVNRKAHEFCVGLGIGVRQLKKWISNHRPKEDKVPVSHPPWSFGASIAAEAFHPRLSHAAQASLAAAQVAVMGQPFSVPLDFPPHQQGPFPPHQAPLGQWPQQPPPVGFLQSFGGQVQGAFETGGWDGPFGENPYQNCGLRYGGGSGSSVASRGSQDDGELGSEAMSFRVGGSGSEGVKQLLRKKLKDFDPDKVKRLFELCVEYRQKRKALQTGGAPSVALAPPSKRPRLDPPPSYFPGAKIPPSSHPPLLDRRDPMTPPSNSGDTSELTEIMKPSSTPKPQNLEAPKTPDPHEVGVETEAPPEAATAGDTSALAGRTLSTLPSFPSIDLSHWALDDLTPANQEITRAETDGVDIDHAPEIPSQELGSPSLGSGDDSASPLLSSEFPDSSTGGRSHHGTKAVSNGCENPGSLDGKDTLELSPASKKGPAPAPAQIPGCMFLFEKVLTASDTKPLGRIIIPKVYAQAHLPKMVGKLSCRLPVRDVRGRVWDLRYSFWSNNRSRMYVLERGADLIKSRGLVPGDTIAFYRAEDGHLVIMERKNQDASVSSQRPGKDKRVGGPSANSMVSGEVLQGGAFDLERTESQAAKLDQLFVDVFGFS